MIAMKFHVLDMWWIVLQRGHSLKNPVCTNNDLLSAEDVHPFPSLWLFIWCFLCQQVSDFVPLEFSVNSRSSRAFTFLQSHLAFTCR